jgi:ubiquinol oxidase
VRVPPLKLKLEKELTKPGGNLPLETIKPSLDTSNGDLYIETSPFTVGTKPESAFVLAVQTFSRQGSSIIGELLATINIRPENYIPLSERPPDCFGFTLDNEAVKQAEISRETQKEKKVETNPASRLLYDIGCFALDELFPGRPIARFWFLEIIARIPYFSYVSMLHLYESFGWCRQPELRKIHYAEEYNELHHLLIMETLGGNSRWRDRFLGYHVAFAYYWAVNVLFLFTPKAAYEFMELLESHAVDTYGTFYKENEERLKSLPAPTIALSYYKADDPYMFDDFQVSKKPKTRKPPCDNLYDVFKNICIDESEHVKTMKACKDYSRVGGMMVSPHFQTVEQIVSDRKRDAWLNWSEEVNRACTAEEDF